MSDFLHRLPEFLGNHFYLAIAFVGVLVALIVTESQRFLRGYTGLTPAGLTQLINRENALVIDVSSQAEFEKGHVPGAPHLLPSQVDPDGKELSKARETPVALLCRNGQASARAAQTSVPVFQMGCPVSRASRRPSSTAAMAPGRLPSSRRMITCMLHTWARRPC